MYVVLHASLMLNYFERKKRYPRSHKNNNKIMIARRNHRLLIEMRLTNR